MASQPQGLSAAETSALKQKLRALKDSLVKDSQLMEEQRTEIADKQKALDEVYTKLKEIRKELLATGGALTEREFRDALRKYLLEIREEVLYLKSHQSSRSLRPSRIRVVLTGAAGQIGYSMLPLIANGNVFGLDQPLTLALLEIEPALKALGGVRMEIDDGAYPLVEEIITTANAKEAFTGADFAILVGGFPRKKGMLRKELLAKNGSIFKGMGEALEKYAKASCKVLVVANPANTNCLICATHAPKIPKKNFSALTRLDYNRARNQVSAKLEVCSRDLANVMIWGNHSATQVPDVSQLTVGGKRLAEGRLDAHWVRGEFTSAVQQRGKAIIEARGFSSAMSAANAAKDAFRDWVNGTPPGTHVPMAVWSNGNPYGIAEGLYYSFPVTCRHGKWSFASDISVSDEIRTLMKASEKELLEERKEAGAGCPAL